MSTENDPLTLDATQAVASRSRVMLTKRLADIVCIPTSRITPQERHITGDLLIEMLRDGDQDLRERCARRVAALSEAPTALIRFLCRDDIEVARPILEDCEGLSESDLVATARAAGPDHRRLIAARRKVPELVADAVADFREPAVIETLLRNANAKLSAPTVERIVADSRERHAYCPLLVKREELRPSQGLALFWWSDADSRRVLLRRFAVDRHVLQEVVSDIFRIAAEEGWSDPLTRKALQFIERRQRNRAALERSDYESLEALAAEAAEHGLNRVRVEEISYLCGLKPATGAQIFTDLGGEPLAVLCKATGLKRAGLELLWRAARRELGEDPVWARANETFDTLSPDKAQTVLRYWNWSLTSALSPALAAMLDDPETDDADFSAAERTARLVFGRRS